MEMKMTVVSPVGEPAVKEKAITASLNNLEGKTICEVWNGSFEGQVSFPIIEEMLRKRFPGVNIIPYTEFPLFPVTSLSPEKKKEKLEALRAALMERRCDAVITGNGG
jgi:ABC-type amino acid transport substrate-binding protein